MIDAAELSVVIATRNRVDLLLGTIDALDAQTQQVEVLVVDQGDGEDPRLAAAAAERPWLRVLRDPGRGLSRARNAGRRATGSRWIAYVDDDCRPEPEFAERLAEAIAAHPEVAWISGHVADEGAPAGEYLPVTLFHVEREQELAGRWLHPWRIGFGVLMVVRRDVVEQLGGWDERLGAGVARFPASEDMDFNYRLLRAGHRAFLTPAVRASHHQWRTPDDLPALFEGYMKSWAAFAVKHLRQGDLRGGAWLWALGANDCARMAGSSVRRRSRLRARVAAGKLRGLVAGTALGLVTRW